MAGFTAQIIDNLHNILVHFPIAIAIVNVFVMSLSYYRNEYRYALRFLLLLNVVFAISTFIAGEFKEDTVELAAVKQTLEIHEKLGTSTLILVIVTGLTGFAEVFLTRLRVLTNLLVIVTAVIVSVTGYYGGLVAHPSGIPSQGLLTPSGGIGDTLYEEYRLDTLPDTLYPLMEEEQLEE